MGAGARYLLALVAVVVFAGGAGLGSWYLTGQALGPVATTTTDPSQGVRKLASCVTQKMANGPFDPCKLAVGSCMIDLDATKTLDLKEVNCSNPNRYRIDPRIAAAMRAVPGVVEVELV